MKNIYSIAESDFTDVLYLLDKKGFVRQEGRSAALAAGIAGAYEWA